MEPLSDHFINGICRKMDIMKDNCLESQHLVDFMENLLSQNTKPTVTIAWAFGYHFDSEDRMSIRNSDDNREKRQLLAGLCLIWSGHNAYKIEQLSSKVDQIAQNQSCLISTVKDNPFITGKLSTNLHLLEGRLDDLARTATLWEYKSNMYGVANSIIILMEAQVRHVQRTQEGIFSTLAGKVLPQLVDPGHLNEAIDMKELME